MDIHPWTKYEIARLRDEERFLRARDAMRARELRSADNGDVGGGAGPTWFAWLRRRDVQAEQPTVRARPV